MEMSDRAMDRVREQIANDASALPALHEQATDLGLAPQPWWNGAFYEHAIQRRQAELEVQSRGGDDDALEDQDMDTM